MKMVSTIACVTNDSMCCRLWLTISLPKVVGSDKCRTSYLSCFTYNNAIMVQEVHPVVFLARSFRTNGKSCCCSLSNTFRNLKNTLGSSLNFSNKAFGIFILHRSIQVMYQILANDWGLFVYLNYDKPCTKTDNNSILWFLHSCNKICSFSYQTCRVVFRLCISGIISFSFIFSSLSM